MCVADEYADIHAKNQEPRTDSNMYNAYLEKEAFNLTQGPNTKVKHIFGIGHLSLFHDFPFFQTSKQLPQGPFIHYLSKTIECFRKCELF